MPRSTIALLVAVLWPVAAVAAGQVRSSSANPYSSGFGSASGGGFGSTTGGGFASGAGNFGTGTTGGGFGRGGGMATGQQGGVMQGSGGLMGTNQQGPGGAGAGFVGNDAMDAQSMFQNMNGRQRQRALFDMALQSLNEMRDSRRDRRRQRRQPPPARVALIPQIDIAPLTPPETASSLADQMTRVMNVRGSGDVSVTMQGRTAVLSGTVATAHDKALAEKLAALEPGVSEVENNVTVRATADE